MRYALRAIAILTGFATGFIAAATVAYARIVSSDPPVVPGRYNRFPGGEAAEPGTGSGDAIGTAEGFRRSLHDALTIESEESDKSLDLRL